MAGKETTGRLALVVNSQTFGWLRNEFLALGWKNRNDEILQGQVQKSSIFCNFFARQTTPTILLTLYPLEICAIRWGPMANIPLQGTTRKIKSPTKSISHPTIGKSPWHNMPTSLIKLCDTGLESRRAFALCQRYVLKISIHWSTGHWHNRLDNQILWSYWVIFLCLFRRGYIH